MAKILLVEDDNNLREIYEARLQAEGYTIVSAHDGEEALVVAKAEKPDLIISDVMMPKISGFEMLDILRNTDALKAVKVIMLTALGQNDDQQRANKLGADRYLVKSQVTLEDIVNVANELLKGSPPVHVDATPASAPPTAAPASDPPAQRAEPSTPTPAAPPEPVAAIPQPLVSEPVSSQPAPEPAASTPPSGTNDVPDLAEPTTEEQQQVKSQIAGFMSDEPTSFGSQSTPLSTPDTAQPTEGVTPTPSSLDAGEPILTPEDQPKDNVGYSPQPAGKKVIEPLPDSENKPDINTLLEKEKAKEIIEQDVKQEQSSEPPTMSAADTAPTPSEPVITPSGQEPVKDSVDPNSSIAL